MAQQLEPRPQRFGFLSLTTVQAASKSGQPDSFAGLVVVGFRRQDSGQASFVMTDEHGLAVVPLPQGMYCADAYETDGKKLKLDPRRATARQRCISLKAGEMLEFSLTIAPNVTYSSKLPKLGVY